MRVSQELADELVSTAYALADAARVATLLHFRRADLAAETKRITSIGSFTPDYWMRKAVGSPLSIEPLAKDCAAALRAIGG